MLAALGVDRFNRPIFRNDVLVLIGKTREDDCFFLVHLDENMHPSYGMDRYGLRHQRGPKMEYQKIKELDWKDLVKVHDGR
jgi:hypothetical protein